MRTLSLSILAACSLASAAFAQPVTGSSVVLQTPVGSATRTYIDGVNWACTGQACVAVGQPRSQSTLRACQRVAARMGPVTAFTYAGRALAADQMAACNAQARR